MTQHMAPTAYAGRGSLENRTLRETRFHTTEVFRSGGLVVREVTGTAVRPMIFHEEIPRETHSLFLNRTGSLTVRHGSGGRWHVIPPDSLFYTRAPAELMIQVSRGQADLITVSWPHGQTKFLTDWIDRKWEQFGRSKIAIVVSCSPVQSQMDTEWLLGSPPEHPRPDAEVRLLARVHDLMADLLVTPHDFCLAQIPANLPMGLSLLLEQVKRDPTQDWSLKRAAAVAGYSPFHLSRSFRQTVGYGFPEFVHRCRAEIAIRKLCTTNESLDEIVKSSGFGSSAAMRDALKEFVGLLPSEIRSMPSGTEINITN